MNIEKAILGCIINDSSIHERIIPQLSIEYFTEMRWLAGIILDMFKRKLPIDQITLYNELQKKTEGGDITDILQLTADAPIIAFNIDAYMQDLKDRFLVRFIRREFEAEVPMGTTPLDFLLEKRKKLDVMIENGVADDHRSLMELIERAQSPTRTLAHTQITGLERLDVFKPGRLIVIAGRPAHGKTNVMLSLAREFCQQALKVVVFSLEMTGEELVLRLMEGTSAGDLSFWDEQLIVIDKAGVDIDFIRSKVAKYKPDIFMIDYLQKIRGGVGEKKTYQIEDNVNRLKNLAKESESACVLLVQASRSIEDRPVKIYEMSDLSDSKGIEAEADHVIFVSRYEWWRIMEYNDGGSTENSLLLQVAKNRHKGGFPFIKTKMINLNIVDYDEPVNFNDYSEPISAGTIHEIDDYVKINEIPF